jgi:hypothetical protein
MDLILRQVYIIKDDTILLTYTFDEELPNANEVLPRTLLINDSTKSIKSVNGTSFSADIYIDNRKKQISL